MHDFAPFLPLVGAVFGLLCLWAAFRAGRRRRIVEGLPTSKTTGVFIGLVELKGTAQCETPLRSFLADEACVCYQWSVEEHWSRTVHETYTDHEGKTRTRTRHESSWTTVSQGGEMIPFYLQDNCGAVLVRPEGANLEPATLFHQTCGRGDPLYYSKGPAHAVANSDHRRQFTERGITQQATIYVLGQARERQDVVAPEITHDPNAPLFLISTRSEEQIASGMKWGQRIWGFLALAMVIGSVVLRDAVLDVPLETRWGLYVAVGLGTLAAAALAWVWMVYNSLVDLRLRVRQAWSLVDIQLKRRNDLLPNLVSLVKGCGDYERQVQTELAALRRELIATPPGVSGPDYSAVVNSVIAIAERYPDLKADTSFLGLQKNLIDTEHRIALARGYFNDIATHYNTRLEIVPERFVALLGAMKPQPLMQANEFERAVVKVDLAIQRRA